MSNSDAEIIRRFSNVELLIEFRCIIQSDESKFFDSENAPMKLLGDWRIFGFVPTSEMGEWVNNSLLHVFGLDVSR